MNVSSSANSFGDSATSISPRQARRAAGSSRRSPTASSVGALDAPAPGERAQAREQLRDGERLGQVVIRADVQAGDAVLDGVTGGQHQDRRPDPCVA
jgi:hypothetical protein